MTPPGEKAVDKVDETENAEQSCSNHTGNLETEPSTVGEGVNNVGRLVLIVVWDDNTAVGESLLGLGIAKLGHGQRGGNRHDTGRDESLAVDAHTDICDQDGASNGCETRGHDLMDFGASKMGDERLDQHGGFTLSDEGRCGSDDSLGTGNLHAPEEEDGELSDEPLEDAPVVEDLDNGHEKDDGGQDTSEEPVKLCNGIGSQECNTSVGKTKKITSHLGDESEDVTGEKKRLAGLLVISCGRRGGKENVQSSLGTQDEEGNDELNQHADNDGVPLDPRTITRSDVEDTDKDKKTEQADGTVGAGVVGALLGSKGTDDDDGNAKGSTSNDSQLLGDQVLDAHTRVVPDEVHWLGNDGDGDVEEDDAEGDGEPEEERLDPVHVMTMQDQTDDPPGGEEEEEEDI